jgi:hypothetical protein
MELISCGSLNLDMTLPIPRERKCQVGFQGSQDCLSIQFFVKNPKFSRKAGQFASHEASSYVPMPAITLNFHLRIKPTLRSIRSEPSNSDALAILLTNQNLAIGAHVLGPFTQESYVSLQGQYCEGFIANE